MIRPLLGAVHLLPLPSSGGRSPMDETMQRALADARAYRDGGFDGVVVENFGDAPFHKGTRGDRVPPDVPAALALVGFRVRTELGLPVAINCLRNDALAALGAAAVAGASWIRVNVLAGAYVTDQGIVEGEAAAVAAYRRTLGTGVKILADYLVKHASPLAPIDVAVGARDLAERSGADAIVLSGARTGSPADPRLFDEVRAAVGAFPIWIGSGLGAANAAALWPRCDGAIVGSSLKRGGDVRAPVDVDRVRALRAACPPPV